MDDSDRKKLETLLNYWVEHNDEHGAEFKEWALANGLDNLVQETVNAQSLSLSLQLSSHTIHLECTGIYAVDRLQHGQRYETDQ